MAGRKAVGASRALATPRQRKTTARAEDLSILVVNGPNLDRLGTRQPEIYGTATLEDVARALHARGQEIGASITFVQTSQEGDIVDIVGGARDEGHAGLILNAAGYTHTSIAILDALLSAGIPAVEVHLSNPEAREEFRHHSMIAKACIGKIAGFGLRSYTLALDALVERLRG